MSRSQCSTQSRRRRWCSAWLATSGPSRCWCVSWCWWSRCSTSLWYCMVLLCILWYRIVFMSFHCILWYSMVLYYILRYCMVLHCWLRRAGCIWQDTYLLYHETEKTNCVRQGFSYVLICHVDNGKGTHKCKYTKTKTKTECSKDPTCDIFWKSILGAMIVNTTFCGEIFCMVYFVLLYFIPSSWKTNFWSLQMRSVFRRQGVTSCSDLQMTPQAMTHQNEMK